MCGITRSVGLTPCLLQLWFAYRMYLWCVESQAAVWGTLVSLCCDLLTECIFDVWNHKDSDQRAKARYVVICLQNVSLMCGITRQSILFVIQSKLWFAYRMYLWCVESQAWTWGRVLKLGCDLLTECIFDVWNHKRYQMGRSRARVVICLQNVSLMCGITSFVYLLIEQRRLWFAYRMYLWCVESQDFSYKNIDWHCCDLLTECIFDVWNHKSLDIITRVISVVICLQNVSLMCGITSS